MRLFSRIFEFTYGCSSIGRVVVSKTIGWEFESLHPCNTYYSLKKMSKLVGIIKESYNELINKVSWPTWSELQNSSIVVAIATVIIALIIYFMDSIFSNLMKIFYSFFG